MSYLDLIAQVAKTAGVSMDTARAVLSAFPEGLILLKHGEWVRTPLGVFRMTERGPRSVRAPGQTGPRKKIPPVMVVKLRSGLKLKRRATKKP